MDAVLFTRDPSIEALLRAVLERRHGSLALATDMVSAGDQVETAISALLVVDDPDSFGDLDYLLRRARLGSPARSILFLVKQAGQSIVALARQHRVRDILVKPLDPGKLQERIQQLLGEPEVIDGAPAGSAAQWLRRVINDGQLSLPLSSRTSQLLQQFSTERLRPSALEKVWRDEPAIIARLLGAANTSSYNPAIKLCETLGQGIQMLGGDRALNLAKSIGLHSGSSLLDKRLVRRSEAILRQSCEVSRVAHCISRHLNVDAEACYTAGLLSQVGELAVLEQMQCWLNQGGALEDSLIDVLLDEFQLPASHELKRQWRIPVVVRDRAGSVHALPAATTVSRDRLVMRIAGEYARAGHTDNVRVPLELLGLSALPRDVTGASGTSPKPPGN